MTTHGTQDKTLGSQLHDLHYTTAQQYNIPCENFC
jgi:hypothetical protein